MKRDAATKRSDRRAKAEDRRAIMRGRREYLRRTKCSGRRATRMVRRVWLDRDLLGELHVRFASTTIVLRAFATPWRRMWIERVLRECNAS